MHGLFIETCDWSTERATHWAYTKDAWGARVQSKAYDFRKQGESWFNGKNFLEDNEENNEIIVIED